MTELPAGERPGSDEFGVYLHVPFCAHRCDYCAFATWTDKFHLVERYVEACLADIERTRAAGGLRPATTVFVGGGTPSLVPPALLARLVRGVETAPGAEVSVECNPESTTPELLEALAGAGVTRISLGVQSLVPHVLESLGRRHSPGTVERAVRFVGEVGFASFNVDLVYGAAGETDDDLAATLEGVLALSPAPPHVSAYALTVEAGTPLARQPERHPDDDVSAARYEAVESRLSAAGLSWYEISNWARPGHECRHNLACWRQADYRGFGCAAHSHLGGHRFANITSPERYVAAVEAGTSSVAAEERLGGPARALEALELSLRTRDGVPASVLNDELAELVEQGLLERRAERLVLSVRGRLLANEVACRLVA